ncbi:MAG TPA: hypothetical protein VNS58_25505 [Puia sp.]|nr:hypothetical protein [Puia sp.]
MKKIIIMLGFAGMLYTHNVKHTKMKDYVFIMRLEAITPEVEAQVLPKWAVLIPQWIAQGHLVDNLVIANEGTLFSGKGRAISHAPINNNGQIVLAVMQIKAENMDQALELAKQSPTLDVGGSVEVREVRPTPVSTSK